MSTEALIDPDEYQAPDTYTRLVADLRRSATAAGKPIIDPRMFARALSMDLQVLAADAHVHRVTLTRAQGSEKLQGFLRAALQVISAATDVNGDNPPGSDPSANLGQPPPKCAEGSDPCL